MSARCRPQLGATSSMPATNQASPSVANAAIEDDVSSPVSGSSRAGRTCAFVVMAGSALAASLGGARAVEVGLPLIAVVLAMCFLVLRRYADYLEFTIWLWLITPGVRRIVDLHAGYHQLSLVLLTAPLVSLLSLFSVRSWRRQVDRRVAALFVLTAVVLGYGVMVSLAKSGLSSTAAGIADWAAPFALAAAVLLLPFRETELIAVLTRVVRGGLIVLSVYAIFQWIVAPPWDVAWLQNVSGVATSFGRGEAYQIRSFSTLNSPGPFALVVGWLLVIHAGLPRWRFGWAATSLGLVALALSQVRSAWLITTLALVLLTWRGRARVMAGIRLTVTLVIVIAALGGPFLLSIEQRAQSISSGSSDASLTARVAFQLNVLPGLLRDPSGAGIGATGAGSRQFDQSSFANTDSGYVSLLKSFGNCFTILFTLILIVALFSFYRRARRTSALVTALAAVSLLVPVGMLFGDVMTSVSGVFTWLGIALCGRWSGPPPSQDPREAT